MHVPKKVFGLLSVNCTCGISSITLRIGESGARPSRSSITLAERFSQSQSQAEALLLPVFLSADRTAASSKPISVSDSTISSVGGASR